MHAIEVENITRSFETTTGVFRRQKKSVSALNGVSFTVPQGELFGFLGPNGAGKTTLTKILSTILLPTTGTARVLGHDVVNDQHALRPKIGIVFGGERGLYWRLSARDNVQFFADLYQVPTRVSKKRIPELLDMVGLTDRADERVEGYSRGMKQRLHIARGLIHDPQVMFLDEPTIGLDPVAGREMRQVIENLKSAGKTIFLTSHYMFEIDALCDRVAILQKGRIKMIETPSDLKRHVAHLEVVEIECLGVSRAAIGRLRAHRGVEAVNVETRGQVQVLQVQAADGAERIPEFMQMLDDVTVRKVVTRQPTLEDAYIKLVGPEAKNA